MVFLKAESENWQLEDFQQAEFSCVCEKISSVNKEEVSSWEFCWLKVTPIVCFFNAFFHPWPNQEMHYVILSRGGSYFFQSLIIRRLFLPIIGLYCVYTINQKTQVLVACRYEISLLMFNLIWVVDEVEHLKMTSISVCAHVVFPIFMGIDYSYNKVIHNGQELSFLFAVSLQLVDEYKSQVDAHQVHPISTFYEPFVQQLHAFNETEKNWHKSLQLLRLNRAVKV